MGKGPEPIGDVVAQLMARRGLAGIRRAAAWESAWRDAAGKVAPQFTSYTRALALRRGKLEVMVANSTIVQEFTFHKRDLIEALSALLPDERIDDLRFRVGSIE
ncbi:MAG: DciA family protein [Planctomycetota bacterium]|jgi:hypothetical protein